MVKIFMAKGHQVAQAEREFKIKPHVKVWGESHRAPLPGDGQGMIRYDSPVPGLFPLCQPPSNTFLGPLARVGARLRLFSMPPSLFHPPGPSRTLFPISVNLSHQSRALFRVLVLALSLCHPSSNLRLPVFHAPLLSEAA